VNVHANIDVDLDLAMQTAKAAAMAASAASLVHFRHGVRVETKPDRTPVTQADREAEAAIFGIIRTNFPDHSLLGEETGEHAGREDTRWIVDPIDGTRGFTRGGSFWGPLIALEHRGVIVAGAMAMPALGEVYWAARGRGAFRQVGAEAPTRLSVSGIDDFSEATLFLGEPRALFSPPLGARITALTLSCAQTRCYGDLAGCAMVLLGRAEVWIEAGVKSWDLGPFPVLVAEAGGRYTDFDGNENVHSGHCVVSNAKLHSHVLAALK
jgi:histidinol-phosphatase